MTLAIEQYTAADGQPLRYGKLVNPEAPNNRALVFVPGLGGSIKGALTFLNALLPEYGAIYGPDLRGFGLNPVNRPILDVQPVIEDLLAFHQHLGRQGHTGFDLSGISLGGSLSTLLLTDYRNRYTFDYDRYVVLAPAYQPHSKTFTTGYVIKNILGRILKGQSYTTRLPYGLAQITRNTQILNDPQFIDALGIDLSIDFLLSLRALNKQALKATRQLKTPTLMFIPGDDLICDVNAMRRGFAQIPADTPKQCREYPGVYHDLLFELEIAEIAAEALAWLKNPLPDTGIASGPVIAPVAPGLGNKA